MVEEYKRLRQRDSTGGSVGMATRHPMGNVVPISCICDALFLPSLTRPFYLPPTPPDPSLLPLPPLPLSPPLPSPFLPSSFTPLSPHRDYKVFMEDYCASVGEHDTSLRGHGTHALHRRGQETTCDYFGARLSHTHNGFSVLFPTWLQIDR